MRYYKHDEYGYIMSLNPPKKNIEKYTEITEAEYSIAMAIKEQEEENEINQQNSNS